MISDPLCFFLHPIACRGCGTAGVARSLLGRLGGRCLL
jgi:hypothetical protein